MPLVVKDRDVNAILSAVGKAQRDVPDEFAALVEILRVKGALRRDPGGRYKLTGEGTLAVLRFELRDCPGGVVPSTFSRMYRVPLSEVDAAISALQASKSATLDAGTGVVLHRPRVAA